jgi:hypothetical protein
MVSPADESSGGDSSGKAARGEQWEPKSSSGRSASRATLRKSLSLSGSDSELLLKAELELQVQLPASSISVAPAANASASGVSAWPAPSALSCASSAAAEEPWHMLLRIAALEHAQL